MNQTISEKLLEVAEVLGVTFEDIPSNKQSFFAKHPREMSRTRRFFLKKNVIRRSNLFEFNPMQLLTRALGHLAENISVLLTKIVRLEINWHLLHSMIHQTDMKKG